MNILCEVLFLGEIHAMMECTKHIYSGTVQVSSTVLSYLYFSYVETMSNACFLSKKYAF